MPVVLDGHPARMAVDSGSQGTVIIPEVATALDLPIDGRHETLVSGVAGGPVDVPNVQLDHILLGSVDAGPISAPRAAVFPPSGGVAPIAGLIGSDVLSQYDVEFDFPARIMTLHEVDGCSTLQPSWTGPYASVPARLTQHQHLVIPVVLDGHPIRALFDTGASSERLTRGALGRVGLTPDRLAGDLGSRDFGVNGLDTVTQLHRFDSIVVAGRRFDHPRIGVFANDLADADMLLGADYMRARKFWLSYSTRQIFVQGPPGVPAEH